MGNKKKDELSAVVHILLLKYGETAIAGTRYYPNDYDGIHFEWKALLQQYYNALANYGCSIYKSHHSELLTFSKVIPIFLFDHSKFFWS